jgi:hypothetical protein
MLLLLCWFPAAAAAHLGEVVQVQDAIRRGGKHVLQGTDDSMFRNVHVQRQRALQLDDPEEPPCGCWAAQAQMLLQPHLLLLLLLLLRASAAATTARTTSAPGP